MSDNILTTEKLAEIEAREAAPNRDFCFTVGRDEKTIYEAGVLQAMINQLIDDRRNLLASHKKLDEEIDRLRNACWVDGAPKKPWASEWFIAETTYGARVVLIELPEEYSYDFKTVDETYIKRSSIKRWMQFPDSQYLSAAADMLKAQAAEIERLTWSSNNWRVCFDRMQDRRIETQSRLDAALRAKP